MNKVLNTLSNLAYGIAGTAILMQWQNPLAILLVAGLLILTYTSGLYHATLTEHEPNSADDQRMADMWGIYIVMSALAFWGFATMIPGNEVIDTLWAFACAAGLGISYKHLDSFRVIGVLAVPTFGGLFVASITGGLVTACITAISLGLWLYDRRRGGTGWPHALWHLGTAAAIYLAAQTLAG